MKGKSEIVIEVASSTRAARQHAPIKRVTRKRPRAWTLPSCWPLALILALQAIVSLVVLHNTAFQDEALYLLAGQNIIGGWLGLPHFPVEWASFLSGYAYFYPVIAGALAMLGGLELARAFSLVCMLCVTASVYYVTRRVFHQPAAILAAALYAMQGPVLFLGRLATYDSLCLLMVALAVVVAVHARQARTPWTCLAIGPLIVLAILAKFAGLLFVPIPLAILAWGTLERRGWRAAFVRLALALCSLALALVIAYLTIDKAALHAISGSTTNRDVHVRTSASYLIGYILWLTGIAFALGVPALALGGWRRFPMRLILFGAALLVPAYHIYAGELISLHKHLAFSLFFIAPLAGYTLARLSGFGGSSAASSAPARMVRSPEQAEAGPASGKSRHRSNGRYWLAGLAICLVTFPLGLQQAQTLYGGWAPSNSLVSAMRTQVRLGSGHYLAEDFDVCRYSLQHETALWQWSSLDFFEYTDRGHHYLVDQAAYRAAIGEGYFDLVELSYGYDAPTAVFISQQLTASHHYELIAKIPNSDAYGSGYFWIWRKV